jgi:aminomuconate-semialdehyde/2-hydroxymuconate-6-semialdehyde dehydrogenase
MKKILNFIGGKFVEPKTRRYLKSFNPATGEAHLEVSASDERDISDAVASANGAFASWSKLPAGERTKYLYKIADLIDARLEELAEAESSDQGKPLWLA